MRLGTAIECLVDNYKYASDKEWINDKVAWALYHTWKVADRKDEPTISKMEQVDKDINVRSKDEPQTDIHGITDCDFCKHGSEEWDSEACDGCCNANNHFEPKDESQTDCAWK